MQFQLRQPMLGGAELIAPAMLETDAIVNKAWAAHMSSNLMGGKCKYGTRDGSENASWRGYDPPWKHDHP